jgi:oligopeptide transport system substrate-binding protein
MGRLFVLLGIIVAAAIAFLLLATGGGSDERALLPEGKVYRVAMEAEPQTLDPIGITDVFSDGVGRKLYNTLVRLQRYGDELRIEPDLCETMPEITDGGRVYTFTLRKNVTFHNGRAMTSADVVYSLMRLLGPESKRAIWIKPFVKGSEAYYKSDNKNVPVGITAVDDYTVRIELEKPFAPFIQHLCTVNCAVVPREAVEDKTKPFARNPVGTGPFKIVLWKDNKRILMARHDAYHHGKPKLAGLRYTIQPEAPTRMELFFQGELDVCDIPVGRLKEAKERAGAEQVLETVTFRTNYLGFGFPNGDFRNKKDLDIWGKNKLLRQALNYAIDREYLCNTVLEGKGKPAKSILPPGMPGYSERPGWKKDLKKAKELLAQAGYPEGKELPPLNIYCMQETDVRLIAQAVANDIAQLGIDVRLQTRERNEFYKLTAREPLQSYLLGWVADYNDPDNFLFVLFHSGQWGDEGNHCWYGNPEVDKLVEEARDTVKMEDRVPLYQKAETIILEDAPWIVTYHAVNIVLVGKQVKGIREKITPLDTGVEFSNIDFAFVDLE